MGAGLAIAEQSFLYARALSLVDLPHRLAVAEDVANRTVVAFLRLLDRLAVGRCKDVFFLKDDAARLRQLVDPVQFHRKPHPVTRVKLAQSQPKKRC